jgi:hypothetical protein
MSDEKQIYDGEFENWDDVMSSFDVDKKDRFKPEIVYKACYDRDGYEGSATVAYRKNKKYYLVKASHCSCYGLEGQWDPEEIETKQLLMRFL